MTLIITFINRHGIIHASDSNLTIEHEHSGQGTKAFKIEFLNAGLTIIRSSVSFIREYLQLQFLLLFVCTPI